MLIINGLCRGMDVFAKGGLAVKSARGFIVLFGFTFVNALIKTLVAESHNKENVEVKHASFDLAMKNQVNTMNAAWGGQWDSKEIMISMGAMPLRTTWHGAASLPWPLPRRRRWWQQTMMALATEK